MLQDSPTDVSRRSHPRVAVGLSAVLVSHGESSDIKIVLIDLGRGGVLIHLGRPGSPGEVLPSPPIGARATLTFRMIGDRMCEAVGQVVRYQDSGFAIQFQSLNQAMESFTHHLAKLPVALQTLYIADILHPRLVLEE